MVEIYVFLLHAQFTRKFAIVVLTANTPTSEGVFLVKTNNAFILAKHVFSVNTLSIVQQGNERSE